MSVPFLMITYNRLAYTKEALFHLLHSDCGKVVIIDNNSMDGTQEFLGGLPKKYTHPMDIIFNKDNKGIAGAMNQFLEMTKGFQYVGKVDNDTIAPENFIEKMLPHMVHADIVQAKHPILKATHPDGFDAWVSTMRAKGALRLHHFVGGSGILFKRNIIDRVPETEWKLGGWRQWQREHPKFIKAFATDVEIQLLDTDENGAQYDAYPDYYKETKRC